jgi:hypothetical protein
MVVGAAIPFINDSFDSTYSTTVNGTRVYYDISDDMSANPDINCTAFYEQFAAGYGLTPPISEATARAYGLPVCPGTVHNFNVWTVITSMFGMIFWSFGGIPFWLDITFFMALRLALFLLIARNIWIGGGG